MSASTNERCRLILAPVGVELGGGNAREKAFRKPLPRRWRPQVGERVYLRPEVSVGGLFHRIVTVWKAPENGQVDVRVPHRGGTWRTRLVPMEDVRPL
jgi:hypothetical protein